MSLPNATGALWAAGDGVVVYSTLVDEDIGWVSVDAASGDVLAASQIMTGHCLPPAYSCLQEFALYDAA